jgi:hypothetical protein
LYPGRGDSPGLRESWRDEESTGTMLPYARGLKRGDSDVAALRSTSSVNYTAGISKARLWTLSGYWRGIPVLPFQRILDRLHADLRLAVDYRPPCVGELK